MVPELLKLGHKVTVLDTFMFGQNSLAEVCHLDNFNVVRGDARDKSLLKSLTKDKDIVIPLAALVGAPLCNRDMIGTTTTNRDAIQTLTDILSKEQRVLMPITARWYLLYRGNTFKSNIYLWTNKGRCRKNHYGEGEFYKF